jgi:HEAT repeat protein
MLRTQERGALDRLVCRLDDRDDAVVARALGGIRALGDPAATPHLRRLGRHPSPMIRRLAGQTLRALSR